MRTEWKLLTSSEITVILIAIIALYLASAYSYLLFHTLVEMIIIIIAVMVFMIAWFSRKTLGNNYLLVLGISYLFIAIIELFHTLAYKGLGVFPTQGADLATQLWISARYLEAATFLVAPLVMKKDLKAYSTLWVYVIITTILLISIFSNVFPACYIEDKGLTTFKIFSEYLIVGMFIGALGLLWKERDRFEPPVINLLMASIVLAVMSELAFTFYIDVYGFFNLAGHLFKLVAFYFIYKAIVVTAFVNPYDLLSKDLVQKKHMLREEKERFQELFENLSNGVAVLETLDKGQSFRFKDINPAAEKLSHIHKDEVIDKDFTEVYTAVHESKLMDVIRRVWESGNPIVIPEIYYRDSRIEGWRELYIYRLSSGEIVIVSKDITTNKELERSQENLTEMLMVINKILRHDISNDLTVLSMSLDAFKENNDPEYLKMSHKALNRSFNRIREMRKLENVITNQLELKPYDLHDVIAEVSKNHPIEIDMKDNCIVMADEGLYSVVDNIIKNAVDHGHATRIEITLNAKNDGSCSVRMADNGIGIPAEIKQYIFKEGFRYGTTGNTGLGLYIVRMIMDRYGSIAVEENGPSGAAFLLNFKRSRNNVHEPKKKLPVD
ncbi:MAG: PAS domain-containing sensor histidine kinase [Methanomethylovorans sp.]|nr:PAS domain-containing sensor histidine kinase [Methanomethylovorans sp.]